MGIKPGTGRFSRDKTGPKPSSIDGFLDDFVALGPLGRYISDIEFLLEVLSGPESEDPLTFIPQYIAPQKPVAINKVAYFSDDGLSPKVDNSILLAIELAVTTLTKNGITLVNDMPEAFPRGSDLMYRLTGYNNLKELRNLPGISSPAINNLLREIDRDSSIHISTCEEREKLDADIKFYKRDLLRFFDEYDAIILPPATFPAIDPEKTFSKEYERGYSHFRWTYCWNVAQFPALVVGSVFQANEGNFDGLPVGVQIVVPPFKEDVAFAIGRILEENINSVSSLHPEKLIQMAQKHSKEEL